MAAKIKKKHFGYLYRALLFMGAVAYILYLFPREGKFRYEYQKGRTWQHNTLIAPFDFPVMKSQKELTAEKDTLLKNHHPYYKVSLSETADIEKQIEKRFDLEWQQYDLPENKERSYLEAVNKLVDDTYSQGVISYSDFNQLQIDGQEAVVVIGEDFAKTKSIFDLQTSKMAYERIMKAVSGIDSLPRFAEFVTSLDLNQYLASNLDYDKELTTKSKEELLDKISLSSGLIRAGDPIVDRGQRIDDNVFKVLESFRTAYEERLGNSEKREIIILGQGIIITVLLTTFYTFLFFYRIDIFNNNRDITFIIVNILIFITITALFKQFTTWSLYLIPFAILPVVLRTFFDSRTAIFANVITILLASFFAGNSFEFILLEITVGMAAAFSLKELYNRGQLFRASVIVFLSYCLIYLGLALVQEGSFKQLVLEYKHFLFFVLNGLLMLFAYPLIYIYEKVFGYLSDVTLMELSDTNHPLLRRLSEKAPGTFQHSIMVSNLAQEAAIRIEANPLLARVGALYHDIGKSVQSVYFTENQTGKISPHNSLEPEESAKIVIDHVKEGVKLANKHGLPKMIVDFILTHHGLGKTKFFMIQEAKAHPDKEIDEHKYMYPGPNPFTKETAILMMADSVEAASRSLEEYTDESINNLVEKIIQNQLDEGFFKYAPITFLEIEKVKETFKEKLKNIYHTRIAYPKEALESQKDKQNKTKGADEK
ncbi:HD family phosphohydrolase [Saccharicrinis sp. FJH54]|uniref:HD family phosphohydrolase n=1 Tax=Saccharicrinis sp. FJH54 TaxID=3344665 RepID=UPI0035D483A1